MAAAARLVIPAAMAIIILLLNPCDALTSFNTNPLSVGKDLIGDQDMESEFIMESHTSRILQSSQPFKTTETTDANKSSVGDCGRPPPRNDSCLGLKTSNPQPKNCSAFHRENPC